MIRTPGTSPAAVVTRDETTGGPLSTALANHGFDVIHWPCVTTDAPLDGRPLRRSLDRLETYRVLAVTSVRGVAALPSPGVRPAQLLVAAVGSSTARALREAGWVPDLVPDTHSGEALAEALLEGRYVTAGDHVLHPTSDRGGEALARVLVDGGCHVDTVTAYRTVEKALDPRTVEALLDLPVPAAITFASPSAARVLHRTLDADLWNRLVERTVAVAIGRTTADALRGLGVADVVVAGRADFEALAQAAAVAMRPRLASIPNSEQDP